MTDNVKTEMATIINGSKGQIYVVDVDGTVHIGPPGRVIRAEMHDPGPEVERRGLDPLPWPEHIRRHGVDVEPGITTEIEAPQCRNCGGMRTVFAHAVAPATGVVKELCPVCNTAGVLAAADAAIKRARVS